MKMRKPTQEEHELIVSFWGKRLEMNIRNSLKTVYVGMCTIVLIFMTLGLFFTGFNTGVFIFWIINVIALINSCKMSSINKNMEEKYNDFLEKKYKVYVANGLRAFNTDRTYCGAVEVNIDGTDVKELYPFPQKISCVYNSKKKHDFPVLLIYFDKKYKGADSFRVLAVPVDCEEDII